MDSFEFQRMEESFAPYDALWVKAGLPLLVVSIVLWSLTQGGPILSSSVVDLSEVMAGYFGTLTIGVGCFLLNVLLGIPYVQRRIDLERSGQSEYGVFQRLPMPRWSGQTLPSEENYRRSPLYLAIMVVGAIGFTLVPAAFTVHGLKKVVNNGELWDVGQLGCKLRVFERAHPRPDPLQAPHRGQKPLLDWIELVDASVLAPNIATPRQLFETRDRSAVALLAPCDEVSCSRHEPELRLATYRDDILRAVMGPGAEGMTGRKFTTSCLSNPTACKGVDVWPSPAVWYVLIALPAMMAVSSTLAFWFKVVASGGEATPVLKRFAKYRSRLRERAGSDANARGQPETHTTLALLTAVLLATLALAWFLGPRFSAWAKVPESFLFGVTAMLWAGPALRRWAHASPWGLALAALAAAGVIAIIVSGSIAVVVLLTLAFGANALAVWNGHRIINSLYAPEVIDPQTPAAGEAVDPDKARAGRKIISLVTELASKAEIPVPGIYWLNGISQPIAFATGRNPAHASIGVAYALVDCLKSEELLKAVLAHEVAHIKNRDSRRHTAMAGVSGMSSSTIRFSGPLSSGFAEHSRWRDAFVAVALVPLLPVISLVARASLSRSREFEADRTGAELCGDPKAMAAALREIGRCMERVGQADAEKIEPVAHMLIIAPRLDGWLGDIYGTHPTVDARVQRLEGD